MCNMEELSFFYDDWFSQRLYGYDESMSIHSVFRIHRYCDEESVKTIKKATGCRDIKTIGMACRRSCDGMSIEDFKNLVCEMEKIRFKGLDDFEKFFTIKTVKIERETGNKKVNTFDFIRVDVGVPQGRKDKISFIKNNLAELTKRVLKKIENSKRFQKYGVPINFLKLSNVVLRCDDLIEFTFELKDIEV